MYILKNIEIIAKNSSQIYNKAPKRDIRNDII